jgi:hypothetical protein
MRKELKKLHGQRLRFRGVVEKFGTKAAFKGPPLPTILLKDVVLMTTGQIVTDHIWFTVGKTLDSLCLMPGDIVEFDARVEEYWKGYVNHRHFIDERTLDYKLTRPTKFTKVPSNVE